MLTMPAMANESTIAGPAWFFASTPVSVKMPVPITMPIPKPIRSQELSCLASRPWCSSSVVVVLVDDGVDVLGAHDAAPAVRASRLCVSHSSTLSLSGATCPVEPMP